MAGASFQETQSLLQFVLPLVRFMVSAEEVLISMASDSTRAQFRLLSTRFSGFPKRFQFASLFHKRQILLSFWGVRPWKCAWLHAVILTLMWNKSTGRCLTTPPQP